MKWITERLGEISPNDRLPLKEWLQLVRGKAEALGVNHTNLVIEEEYPSLRTPRRGGPWVARPDYSEGAVLVVYGDRAETEKRRERDLETLRQLKKKYPEEE